MSQVNLEQLIKKAMAESQSFHRCQVTKPGQVATISIGGKTVKAICPTVVTGSAVAIKLDSPYNGIEWVVVGSNTSGQISSQTLDDRRSSPQPKELVDRFDPDGVILYGKWSDEPVINPPINNSESSWTKCPPYPIESSAKHRIYYFQYPHAGGEYATEEDALADKKKEDRSLGGSASRYRPLPMYVGFYWIGSPEKLDFTPFQEHETIESGKYNVSKAVENHTFEHRINTINRKITGFTNARYSMLGDKSSRNPSMGSVYFGAFGGIKWRDCEDKFADVPFMGSTTYRKPYYSVKYRDSSTYQTVIIETGGKVLREDRLLMGAGREQGGSGWVYSPLYNRVPSFGIAYRDADSEPLSNKVVFFRLVGDTPATFSHQALTDVDLRIESEKKYYHDFDFVERYDPDDEPRYLSINNSFEEHYDGFGDKDVPPSDRFEFYYGQNLGDTWAGYHGFFLAIRSNTPPLQYFTDIKNRWGYGEGIELWSSFLDPNGSGGGGGGGGGGGLDENDPSKVEKVLLRYKGYVEHLHLKDFQGKKTLQIPLSFRAFCVNQAKQYANEITTSDSDKHIQEKFGETVGDELNFLGCFYSNIKYQISNQLAVSEVSAWRSVLSPYLFNETRPSIFSGYAVTRETREHYVAGMDSNSAYIFVYVLYGTRINPQCFENLQADLKYFAENIIQTNKEPEEARSQWESYIRERTNQRLSTNENNFGFNHLACYKIKKSTFQIESSAIFNYPDIPTEEYYGLSGYILQVFSRYSFGSESYFGGESLAVDDEFYHATSIGSDSQFNFTRCYVPGLVSTYKIASSQTGKLLNAEIYGSDFLSLVENRGKQKQYILPYGFSALQKMVREDLPVAYGALGATPNTRNNIKSYNNWIAQFGSNNYVKPLAEWTEQESSWYNLTLKRLEIPYVSHPSDRLAFGTFHNILYGVIFDLPKQRDSRADVPYGLFLTTVSIPSPIGTSGVFAASLDYATSLDTFGFDAALKNDGVEQSYFVNISNIVSSERLDFIIDWQKKFFDFDFNLEFQSDAENNSEDKYAKQIGAGLQSQKHDKISFFIADSALDYIILLPFFSFHNSKLNTIICPASYNEYKYDNQILLKLHSGFKEKTYQPSGFNRSSQLLFQTLHDSYPNSLYLSHLGIYRDIFLDKNSNKWMNTSNSFTIELTKTKQNKNEAISLTATTSIQGLNIPFLPDKTYNPQIKPKTNPKEYLDNQATFLEIKAVNLGQEAIELGACGLTPSWAGRLWHFMPIEKG